MELFPQVVAGCRGELRILQNIYDGTFCKNSQKLKAETIFAKTFILDVWQSSKYASELASKYKLRMFYFWIDLNIKGNR